MSPNGPGHSRGWGWPIKTLNSKNNFKLFTDPEDTKRIALKYDTEGKLPSLSRSDKQFIEEANFETTQIRSLKIS